MSQNSRDWWKGQISLSLVFHVVLTVGGWVAVLTTLRVDVAELGRRVNVLETEVVPRREHEAKDRLQEQQNRLLDERLNNLERMLGQLLERNSK